MDVLKVQLDTGIASVEYIEVPSTSTGSLGRYVKVLEQLIAEKFGKSPEVVVTSFSRFSFHMAQSISRMYNMPLILRISDLGVIGKFKEALSYHWYQSMLELPAALIRLEKAITSRNITIAHTAAIFKFIESHLLRKSILIYPTYAKLIPKDWMATIKTISNIENNVNLNQPMILGITKVSRRGLAGKHDNRVLECLYLISKYNPNITVSIIGTKYDEARKILGKSSLPSNLKFLGIINNDFVLEYIYKKASLVVVPFFFSKTISNRLLEALFYGRPTLVSSYLKEDFPDLKHSKDIYMFNKFEELPWLVQSIFRSDDILDNLEENAKKAWERIFSDKIFGLKMNTVLRYIGM
ncbi:MAG: glycosyltransferase [Nitrososphaeria archaeon]